MREFEYPVLDCEAIGGRIREERVKHSFTIQEVCDALSVSPQAVGKWQRGESLPSIDNLVALCTLFGVSVEGILFGENDMPFSWCALRRTFTGNASVISFLVFCDRVIWNGFGGKIQGIELAIPVIIRLKGNFTDIFSVGCMPICGNFI